METVSLVMRAIRSEMRSKRPVEMSMQQFRALGVVRRHPGASLQVVAGHLGLTTASASKLIDRLAKQGFVSRSDCPDDRRRLVLTLTRAGENALETARAAALGRVSRVLESMTERDKSGVVHAMDILNEALAGP